MIETDSDLRERLQDIPNLPEDHVNKAAIVIGEELDTLAGFYGLRRLGATSTELRIGAFYWVNIIANDTQEGLFSDSWQPARYTGRAGDTVGDTWDFLGYYSATGHHDVEVVKVGPEIVPVL